jgi:hypothetical protein
VKCNVKEYPGKVTGTLYSAATYTAGDPGVPIRWIVTLSGASVI